jgi:ribosomal protein L22
MGFVYLIQPCELRKTNRYKVGCSTLSNLSRITCGYRKGFIPISIMSCDNPREVERVILSEFYKHFKLISGQEYFEGDIRKMSTLFYDIVHSFRIHGTYKKKDKKYISNNQYIFKTYSNEQYYCKYCKYFTENKQNFQRHESTKKHQKNISKYTSDVNCNAQNTNIDKKNKIHYCTYCEKGFKHRQAKSRHMKLYCPELK